MNKMEQKTLLELLREIPDYRRGNAVQHDLAEVLMIGILSILCGGMTFTAMELFGETHLQELKKYLELKNGIPSHDTFGDIFSRISPSAVEACFELWLGEFKERINAQKEGQTNGHVVSIDGKTIRRNQHSTHKAHHVITAFCSDLQLVLGQLCTDEKSNEITAIPKLLELLTIQGCTVTIDAMGTQHDIAKAVRGQGADYILAVKANQPELLEFLQFRTRSELEGESKEKLKAEGRYAETMDKGHGRIEQRECFLFPDMSWYDRASEWENVAGYAMIRSVRQKQGGDPTVDYSYFIYSRAGMTAEEFLKYRRSHWAIENSLHWVLDVTFGEDGAHIRLGNAAVVLNIFRKLVLQVLKKDTSTKGSVQSKLLRCAWDFSFALSIISSAAFPVSNPSS